MNLPKFLVFIGVTLLLIGVFWQFFERLGFGKLPGDFTWKSGKWVIHFPLMTSIIVSCLLSLILFLIQNFRR